MPISSVSDLSQSLFLRRQNAALRQNLLDIGSELSTGKRTDIVTGLGGNLAPLQDLERGVLRAESYLSVIAGEGMRFDAAQNALSSIRETVGDHVSTLMLVQGSADIGLVRNAGRQGAVTFDAVVSALNVSVGGASLFSGVRSDAAALAPARTMLDSLEAEIGLAGTTTAADVTAIIDSWFLPGGGFDTVGYLGGPVSGSPSAISETATVDPLPRAADPEIREYLSALAKSAIIERGVLDSDPDEQTLLAKMAGLALLAADEGLVALQSVLGTQQKRISVAETEVKTWKDTMEIARADLIGVDPFDAATRLQATEGQLQSLYAVTARLAALSLTDYLS